MSKKHNKTSKVPEKNKEFIEASIKKSIEGYEKEKPLRIEALNVIQKEIITPIYKMLEDHDYNTIETFLIANNNKFATYDKDGTINKIGIDLVTCNIVPNLEKGSIGSILIEVSYSNIHMKFEISTW